MNAFLNQLNYKIQIFPFYLKINIDIILFFFFTLFSHFNQKCVVFMYAKN